MNNVIRSLQFTQQNNYYYRQNPTTTKIVSMHELLCYIFPAIFELIHMFMAITLVIPSTCMCRYSSRLVLLCKHWELVHARLHNIERVCVCTWMRRVADSFDVTCKATWHALLTTRQRERYDFAIETHF